MSSPRTNQSTYKPSQATAESARHRRSSTHTTPDARTLTTQPSIHPPTHFRRCPADAGSLVAHRHKVPLPLVELAMVRRPQLTGAVVVDLVKVAVEDANPSEGVPNPAVGGVHCVPVVVGGGVVARCVDCLRRRHRRRRHLPSGTVAGNRTNSPGS